MVFLRRRGKKFKAMRFYDADFYNLIYGNLKKQFHEKLLFFVRQSKRFSWRVSSKINPYKLRKRKRSPRSLKFLAKQQLKYFFGCMKEYQFRSLYRKILGYKKNQLNKTLLASLVRFFEGRIDTFLFKYHLAHPFNIQKVLKGNVFSLNDANTFLKRSFLLSAGDRYSLSSFFTFMFYIKQNLALSSFFKKKKKRIGRKRSLFVGRWKLRFFYKKKKKQFFFRIRKKKKRLLFKRLLNGVLHNSFLLKRTFFLLKPQSKVFKRLKHLSVGSNFFLLLRKRVFMFKKYKRIPIMRLFLRRFFSFGILRFRRYMYYKFYKLKNRKKRRYRRFFSRLLPFKPWSLFMKWRVGFLLPDPFLGIVFFLEQPNDPKDMLFSFSFNVRNLLYVYQAVK